MFKKYEVTKLDFPADHEEYREYCLKAIKKCRDNLKKDNRLLVLVDLDIIVRDLQKRDKEFGQQRVEHYRKKLEEKPDLVSSRIELKEALEGDIYNEGFFYAFVGKEVGHAISHIDYIKDRDGSEDINNIMAAKFHLDCVLKPKRGSFSLYRDRGNG